MFVLLFKVLSFPAVFIGLLLPSWHFFLCPPVSAQIAGRLRDMQHSLVSMLLLHSPLQGECVHFFARCVHADPGNLVSSTPAFTEWAAKAVSW